MRDDAVRPDFAALFARHEDPWDYGAAYEQEKYERTLALLPSARSDRALEIGCAEGRFTERLAARASSVLAVDVAPAALRRAAARCAASRHVRFALHEPSRSGSPSSSTSWCAASCSITRTTPPRCGWRSAAWWTRSRSAAGS